VADITRTYASGPGIFSDLIMAMDKLQLNLISSLKPGVSYIELHLLAHR